MTLLDKTARVVQKLSWLKPISVILLIASVGLFAAVIITDSAVAADDRYLLPSVVVLVWSVLLCTLLYSFADVPEPASKEQGFFSRLKTRIKRFYYSIMLTVCLLSSFAVLFLTLKALRLWLANFG